MPELGAPLRPQKKFRPYRLVTEQEAKRERRIRRAFATFVLAMIALAAAAYAYVYYNSFFEQTEQAQLATQTLPLTAKVSGKVTKVFVKETQVVKTGDPLVQIDPGELQATLNQRQQELVRSDDRLAGGKIHLERLQKAANESSDPAARKRYDEARSWFIRQQSKNQELRQRVAEAQEKVNATIAIAPGDGHIAAKLVDVGATVTEGQRLVEFVGSAKPWLVANFKEAQLEKIKVGQRAEISVPGLNKTFTGKVESMPPVQGTSTPKSDIEKVIAFFTKTGTRVPVRIAFDPKSIERDANKLVNGSSAEVKVYIK
jgi:membrane fusion protein (multidrug efflux system)